MLTYIQAKYFQPLTLYSSPPDDRWLCFVVTMKFNMRTVSDSTTWNSEHFSGVIEVSRTWISQLRNPICPSSSVIWYSTKCSEAPRNPRNVGPNHSGSSVIVRELAASENPGYKSYFWAWPTFEATSHWLQVRTGLQSACFAPGTCYSSLFLVCFSVLMNICYALDLKNVIFHLVPFWFSKAVVGLMLRNVEKTMVFFLENGDQGQWAILLQLYFLRALWRFKLRSLTVLLLIQVTSIYGFFHLETAEKDYVEDWLQASSTPPVDSTGRSGLCWEQLTVFNL